MDLTGGMASTTVQHALPRAPDVMNDPAFDTNSKGKQKSVDEPDTCRICRGEGSKEEPLFYPCKCSGSIKFVHQNCLMEWLSHSQKKHCELCKTPFRFTKLYHPHMPNKVPPLVFLRQATIHSWKSFLTWSRFHLVLFVWVAWLPWCMRTVFRGLFWIGDGGWINWQETQRRSLLAAQEHLEELAKEGTTPATTGFFESRNAAASAVVSHMANALPQIFFPVSPGRNVSEPFMLRLAKNFLQGVIGRSSSEPFSKDPVTNATIISVPSPRSSWLSDVSLLNSFTRSPTLNNLLIDTLEGQLITIGVVIAFILIFLIREWVVQQQPGVNMGAGVQQEAAAARQGEEVPMLQQLARQHAEQRLRRGGQGDVPPGGDDEDVQAPEPPRRARVIARPRQRRVLQALGRNERNPQDTANIVVPESGAEAVAEAHISPTAEPSRAAEGSNPVNISGLASASQQRPGMPTKDTLDTAAEIRRTIDEQSRGSGHSNWPGVKVFMDLWERAERNPTAVLNIIDEEGRNEELSWVVAAMKRLESTPAVDDSNRSGLDLATVKDGQDDLERKSPEDADHDNAPHREDVVGSGGTIDSTVSESLNEKASNDPDPLQSSTSVKKPIVLEPMRTTSIPDPARQTYTGASDFNWDNVPPTSEPHATESSDRPQERNQSIDRSLPNGGSLVDTNNDNPFHPDYVGDDAPDESRALDEPVDLNQIVTEIADREQTVEGLQAESGDSVVRDARSEAAPNGGINAQGLVDTVLDWLWGGLAPIPDRNEQAGGDDEHVVDNLAEEAPFVPVEHGQPVIEDANNAANPGQDPDVVAAALQAGLDPNEAEAIEDGEDLEGIMELVGMQGPMAGLIQNGMFCAVLVSLTIFFGMWIPYIAGKVFLVFLANPISLLFKLPLRWTSTSADLIIDMCVFSAGLTYYWVDMVVRYLCAPFGWLVPFLGRLTENHLLADFAKSYAESALERLADTFVETGGSLSESDVPTFSILAHESLRGIEQRFVGLISVLRDALIAVAAAITSGTPSFAEIYEPLGAGISTYVTACATSAAIGGRELIALASSVLKINPLRVSLSIPQRTRPLDLSLAYWDTNDRILAIFFGYLFFSLIGVLYLRTSASLRGTKSNGKVQGPLADVLYQAGGVMKVILIISIEMIVFPLYCGLLLDLALLPLFGDVTVMSRLDFTLVSPWTSIFIHWFVGTCYMFHFALFVSMCRKIMRSGVLCRLLFTQSTSNTNFIQTSFVILTTPLSTLSGMFLSAVSPLSFER